MVLLFFFSSRRRHTRCLSDWSSDVCSSDLLRRQVSPPRRRMPMTHAATKPSQARQLEPPRFENGKALLIAGLRSDYTPESMNDLPVQWQRLVPHLGKIPGQIGRTAYGVSWCPENSPA